MMVATLLLKGHSGWREEKNSVSLSALGPKVSLQEKLTQSETLTRGLKLPKANVNENSRVCLSRAGDSRSFSGRGRAPLSLELACLL